MSCWLSFLFVLNQTIACWSLQLTIFLLHIVCKCAVWISAKPQSLCSPSHTTFCLLDVSSPCCDLVGSISCAWMLEMPTASQWSVLWSATSLVRKSQWLCAVVLSNTQCCLLHHKTWNLMPSTFQHSSLHSLYITVGPSSFASKWRLCSAEFRSVMPVKYFLTQQSACAVLTGSQSGNNFSNNTVLVLLRNFLNSSSVSFGGLSLNGNRNLSTLSNFEALKEQPFWALWAAESVYGTTCTSGCRKGSNTDRNPVIVLPLKDVSNWLFDQTDAAIVKNTALWQTTTKTAGQVVLFSAQNSTMQCLHSHNQIQR